MPSLLNFIPNAVGQGDPQIIYGQVVSPAPTSLTSPLRIVIPDWSTDFPFAIDDWPAVNGSVLPAVNDDVLLIVDNRKQMRVVWWEAPSALWGGVTLPASPPGASNETILSNGAGGSFWGTIAAGGGSSLTARASNNPTGFTTPNNVWAAVPLGTVEFDPSGLVNTGTGRVTVPVAGYYLVEGEINVSGTGSGQMVIAGILKNGQTSSPELQGSAAVVTGSLNLGSTVCGVVSCNANDYLQLGCFSNTVGLSGASANWTNYISVTAVSSLPGVTGTETRARAYRTAGYTLTSGAWTAVPLDTIDYDPAGRFNTGTGTYTCPASGTYLCVGSVMATPGGTNHDVFAGLKVNSTIPRSRGGIGPGSGATVGAESGVVADILNLNSGDTIQLAYFASSADTLLTGIADTYLSVVQVGTSMNFTAAGGDLTGTYPNPTLNPPIGMIQYNTVNPGSTGFTLAGTVAAHAYTGNGVTAVNQGAGRGWELVVPKTGCYRFGWDLRADPGSGRYCEVFAAVNGSASAATAYSIGVANATDPYTTQTANVVLNVAAGTSLGLAYHVTFTGTVFQGIDDGIQAEMWLQWLGPSLTAVF